MEPQGNRRFISTPLESELSNRINSQYSTIIQFFDPPVNSQQSTIIPVQPELILLTGMGQDGAEGMTVWRSRGWEHPGFAKASNGQEVVEVSTTKF
jgi:hypothetical protein